MPCRDSWFEILGYEAFCSKVIKNIRSDSHCRSPKRVSLKFDGNTNVEV